LTVSQQQSLFVGDGSPHRLALPKAEAAFYERFFSPGQADLYLQRLLAQTRWQQDELKLYGRVVKLPRLTAWHGDSGAAYTYSGIVNEPATWTPVLLEIKEAIEAVSCATYNSVLLNLYRGGRDSVSWHADDESELGEDPVIGSVSFGETREFQFRPKQGKAATVRVALTHGSFLLMGSGTQRNWEHCIPKTSDERGPRLNLTFRQIVAPAPSCAPGATKPGLGR
jgi:alkylated DNA repair dioxygenase AlkB